jgi:uncharacterized membrane protein YdbT with pleckstrin-like domain
MAVRMVSTLAKQFSATLAAVVLLAALVTAVNWFVIGYALKDDSVRICGGCGDSAPR